MKRKLVYILALGSMVAVLATPFLIGAEGGPGIPAPRGFGVGPTPAGGSSSGDLDIAAIIGRITNWLFGFLLAAAAVFIVIAAFFYLGSGGSTEKIETANRMILYTVIAIGVAAISKVLVAVVQYFVGR